MVNEKMFELGNRGSAIRELFEYGKKRKQIVGEENVFDYSIGNPSIASPSIVNETLIKLLKEKDATSLHGYTSAVGDFEARKSIADYVNASYGTKESPNLIYLTCGAAASLTITMHALLTEGEEIVAIAPFFPEYRVFCENAGGVLKVAKSNMETFLIDFESLESTVTKKTKAIIINSPNNPTGVVLTKENLECLAAFLKKKEKEYGHPIFIIADEPYRELVYDDKTEVPFLPAIYPNTIVCYSFSKSISLPGERIGYILVGSGCVMAERVYKAICGAGRSLGFVCAPALFQYMIPYVLGKTSDLSIYKENRDTLYKTLKEMGYTIVFPDGAFYLWVKALEKDANQFAETAKKYDLLLVPSDSFGVEGYVRIAYCQDPAMIKRSLPAFLKLMEDYKNR